jgi:Ca2+-binding RTX toxin-like protein
VTIDAPEDLTAGEHTKTFALGGAAGQVALPAASVADYFLLAVADLNEQLLENDVDPQNEDNLAVFSGAYHEAGGGVMVHGTELRDIILVSGSRGVQTLQLNGVGSTYLKGAYTRFYIHTHEGDDFVNGKTSAKDLFVWGAEGNDNLTGGLGNDRLYCGEGADRLSGLGGNDQLHGHGGTDTLVTGFGRDTLRPGSTATISR